MKARWPEPYATAWQPKVSLLLFQGDGMTDELRWILLGVGALLIVGLWLWESVRARRKPLADDAFNVTPPVGRPPTTTGPGGIYRANPPPPVAQEPVWEEPRWSATETGAFEVADIHVDDDLPPLEPPVVQLPDHHAVESTAALPVITPTGSAYDRPRVEVAAPEPKLVEPPPAPRPRPNTPPRQKIVALRLVGPTTNARFSGAELRQALEAEGLVFGRYHIFHREVDDKQLLFSVASLIEPGSFELHEMSTLELPGVSLFAVLPGAVEGTHVVDELVACGRRLAGRLNGVLQDERRQPLTAVRVMELRDEVASFERSLFADGTDDAD
jgi:cell division protein ZipA